MNKLVVEFVWSVHCQKFCHTRSAGHKHEYTQLCITGLHQNKFKINLMDLHQNLIVVVRASLLNQKQEALKETQHLPQGKERNNSDKSAVKQPAKSNIYTAVMNVITITCMKHLTRLYHTLVNDSCSSTQKPFLPPQTSKIYKRSFNVKLTHTNIHNLSQNVNG